MTAVRRSAAALAALILLAGGGPSARPQAPPELASALRELDARLPAEFAKDGVGGASIGVVSGSALVWSRHYGFADMEAKRVATNDTAYRIGSVTKQFTALALLQQVEAGRMRLTDPLEKHVPEIRKVGNAYAGSPPITLLQVASMISGLSREPGCPNHSVGPVSAWAQKVLECLPQTTYAHEPGTQYLYSNIGYAALGLAVERAAGRPFTDLVMADIVTRLGMTRTAFEPTPRLREDLAHGYTRQGGQPSRQGPDRELDGRGYRVPNGALFSTVTDLAKFIAWELGEGPEGVLAKDTQDANYGRVYSANGALTSGYGVGFQFTRRGDMVALGHGGSTAGYRASALVHRPSKLGVIVLRNAEGGGFEAGAVALGALERLVAAARARAD